MNLLTCILIAIPIGIIFIMLWIYNDYRKYKKKNKLVILLFLLFPTTLSAQYVDAGCQVSFKWLKNQKGKLEYTKDGVTYIIRKTKCFDFWERNVLFPKTKRSFFRTPTPSTLPFSA